MTVAMAVASQESKRAVDLFSSNHAVLSSIHDFTGLPQHAGERLGLVLSYLVSRLLYAASTLAIDTSSVSSITYS